ncbi:MAG: sodium:calcium antiporter [Candidatus Gracilibacteria bacterium]|nr:sodium:calcium antiporter [Candidatus Gracilibacteria bacterium]
MFLPLLIFLLSAVVLVKSADLLVGNSEKLGIALKVPHFITGVLILSLGTSFPELATGIASVMKGEPEMLVGNVIGSDIANILIGLGLLSLIAGKSIRYKQDIFEVHFPVLVMSVFALVVMLWDSVLTPLEGVLLLLIMIGYIWFLVSHDKESHDDVPAQKFSWKLVFFIVLGLVGLVVSSHFLIESVIDLADRWGLGRSSLAATLVAVGTSIPELVVGYSAIKRRNTEMVIGNILGSNIFNIVLILSVGSFLSPLNVSSLTTTIMLPFLLGTLAVYWVTSKDKEITIQEGAGMAVLYVLFLGKLFGFL